MNLRNIVGKITGITLGVLTVDSWRIAKIEQNRANAQYKLQTELDKLNQANLDKDLADMAKRIKIEASTGRIHESQSEIDSLIDKSNSIIKQLNKGDLNGQQKEELLKDLSHSIERKTELINRVNNEVKDINDTFKNDLFEFIHDFIDWYKEFLSNQSAEHLGCLSNIIGFTIILITLNSIIIIYYGNNIINYLNLESKYPQLAKFIQVRRKILDRYIKFQIVYIYIISFIFIIINIYMFFW